MVENKIMNAHEKLDTVIERIRHTFQAKGLGDIFDILEIWLVDDHEYVASIRGKRIEIKTYIAWILREGGIAFLIGHETYHFIKNLEKQHPNMWQESLDLIDKSKLSGFSKIISSIVLTAVAFPVNRFISRSEEHEADQFGKAIVVESGYNLSDVDHLFSIYEMRNSQGGGFLDTHPEYNDRKRRLGLSILTYI